MPDSLSAARRSQNMAAIRSKNTKPEMLVRRLVHALGYRYRLHAKGLPGKPDMVFRPRQKAIFVHGCFWHQHQRPGCPGARKPKSNRRYWNRKLGRNQARDAQNLAALKLAGWKTLVIWECETRQQRLAARLRRFLG